MKILCKKDFETRAVPFKQGELYEVKNRLYGIILDKEIINGYFILGKSGRVVWMYKNDFSEYFYDEDETINITRTELIDKIIG